MAAGRVFLVMSVVGAAAIAMLGTTSGLYLIADVGLSPLQLVLVGSVLEGTVLLFEVPTGVVADVVSRRRSVLIGIVLTGIGFCIYAVPLYAVILLAQVVWGLGATFVSGAAVAWVMDEIGEDEGRPLLLRAANLAQAAALGGIAAGVLLGAVELWLPLLAGGLTFLALAGWLALVMPEEGFVRPERTPGGSSIGDTLRSAVQRRGRGRSSGRCSPSPCCTGCRRRASTGSGSSGCCRRSSCPRRVHSGSSRGSAACAPRGSSPPSC